MTALAFYEGPSGTLLLAGEGSFLKVFEAKTANLLSQYEVFDGQAIHGIAIKDTISKDEDALAAVIWGGQCLALLPKKGLDQLLKGDVGSLKVSRTTVSDWILDVAISSQTTTGCILVTAHNTVVQARLGPEPDEILLNELPSPSKSILYSAHLMWDSDVRILVAAGTVFGEIIVWDITVAEHGTFARSQVLFTFTGHEGSIFGVNISPQITGPNGCTTRFLASCSDDRTIRIWDLSESLVVHRELDSPSAPRETGFGENQGLESNVQSQERCVATVMGHASRIWRVQFLVRRLEAQPSIINVLSFGEDSTAQQWALDFDKLDLFKPEGARSGPNPAYSEVVHQGNLRQVDFFSFHSGKHLWSSALHSASHLKGNRLLATGGADGKISLFEVKPMSNATTSEPCENADIRAQKEWDLSDVYGCLSPNTSSDLETHDIPVDLHREDEVTAVSEDGKPIKKKKPKKLPKDAFNRYAFVSNNEFIATTTFGRVLSGVIGSTLKWEEIALPKSGKDDLKSYSVVEGFSEIGLVFLAGANGKIYYFSKGSPELHEVGNVASKVADMFKISDPKTKGLLVTNLASHDATMFTLDQTCSDGTQFQDGIVFQLPERFVITSAGMCSNLLVMGSRNGSLAIYETANPAQPICLWNNGEYDTGDAITSITALPSSSAGEGTYFLTTGRNSLSSIFTLTNNQINPIHHGTPPFGPNIESAWFSGPQNELLLSGFRSKNFVVWNESLHQELTNVECGGAHRSYAYSPAGHFIYTKASKLYLHSQPSPSHTIIKRGGHGREIKTCAVSPDHQLFATGAEDTSIRIWQYTTSPEKRFECLAVTQRHTAGIQHLQWYSSSYLFSSGGNEEFYIWAVTRIPGFGIGIICEASCPDQSIEKDLRIMSFDVSSASSTFEPESDPQLRISLAYSDSTIRRYNYSKRAGYKLLAKGRYTSSCLTQIKHHPSSIETFLTASTDGFLTLWTTAGTELEVVSNTRVHQNAIKSLDISLFSTPTRVQKLVVATGGDDNTLAVTIFPSTIGTKPQTFKLHNAHAAAVTGLVILPHDSRLRIVSSGNDQRVKEWDVDIGGER